MPLVLIEAALRLFGPILPGNYNTGSFLTTHPVYGRFHVPSFDGWVKTAEYTSRVTIDSRGLRGPERPYAKPANTHRILVLGDSFTEAVQVPEADAFVSRLETSLNARGSGRYEVLNGGVGGWGNGQELVYLLEEGYRYQPDLVVMLLYLGNDIFDNSWVLQGKPKNPHEPYWVYDDDGTFAPMAFRTRKPEDVSPVVATLRERVMLWNVFETGVLEKLADADDDSELRANRFNLNKMIVHATRPSERQDDAWKVTLGILQRLRQTGEERGFRTALVIAPAQFQVYDADWGALLAANDLKASDWDASRPNAVLAAHAGEIGMPMLDLLPPLRAAADASPVLLYYPYDKHWTSAGHAVAAQQIGAFLDAQGLTP
ncbi:MAG: hypothetical protein IT305_22510 [Chloroflexi bacterium]|nr:hypothetical protein [Chloroflexota bacterium]